MLDICKNIILIWNHENGIFMGKGLSTKLYKESSKPIIDAKFKKTLSAILIKFETVDLFFYQNRSWV